MHRRHHDAEAPRELLAELGDALRERASARHVDGGDELVAELDRESVERQRGVDGLGGRELRAAVVADATRRLVRRGGRRRVGDATRDREHRDGEREARDERHPRHEPEARHDDGSDGDSRPSAEELRVEGATELVARRRARHHDAGGGRDEQRGDLRRERVTDAEDREGLGGVADVHAARDAEHEAADQVDGHDQQAGDGVAVDELARAVHRAEEVRLALELTTTRARLILGDRAGREVGVDRHLLAGHRVEGEARRDLGDAARALRDDDEVDDREDEEDDETDEDVALDDEATERLDDGAGRALALAAVEEDEARRGDVQAEAKQASRRARRPGTR